MGMDTELRCPVCSDFFTDAVTLQCMHHICAQHVGSLVQGHQLQCPVCGDVCPEDRLVQDGMLQQIVDIWRKNAAPQQTGDNETVTMEVCGFCEEKTATRRCVQCAGVLCEDCEQTSHSKGFFKTHNVVDFTPDDQSPAGALDASRMLCDQHPAEKLGFYCLDCRKPVCSHCLILGDHKGHQQTPIDQAFETGKETVGAWVDRLRQRMQSTETLLEQLRTSECEVDRGAEAQRDVINHEMDHLRELIETKRQQLLSKSLHEEKQKRTQLQAQIAKVNAARLDAAGLVGRSEDILALNSEHAFLSVVLPLIQDMKMCAQKPVDDGLKVSTMFRPLSTDAQVRSLGELDLGHPRPPQSHIGAAVPTMVGPSGGFLHQGHVDGQQQQSMVVGPTYNVANATISYLPQQTMPPVQYVYRTVTTQQ